MSERTVGIRSKSFQRERWHLLYREFHFFSNAQRAVRSMRGQDPKLDGELIIDGGTVAHRHTQPTHTHTLTHLHKISERARICILKVKRELRFSPRQLLKVKLNIEFLRGRRLGIRLTAVRTELGSLKEINNITR